MQFLAFLNLSFGQNEYINTDRPDQSDGVYVIPKNKWQIENGVTISKQTFMNNFMLRYGLNGSSEVRLLIDAGKEDAVKGVKPLAFSVKQNIVNQRALLPAITFVGYVYFSQVSTKAFRPANIPFELKLAFENELNKEVSIGYNIGTSEQFQQMNCSFNIGYTALDKLLVFGEYFSSFTKFIPQHNFDVGLQYKITPALQIDIASGRSIADKNNRFFTTLGVSYILNERKMLPD